MDYAAALIEHNRLLADVVRDADPETPVPTCPGWTVRQLQRHVGRGDRWAAQIIRERADSYLDPRQVPDGRPPDDPAGADAWLVAGAHTVIDAVTDAGPQTPVWTFIGPRPAAWWLRRRLHEATVHQVDAALAAGTTYHLAPPIAADGIDEWLDRLAVELQAGTAIEDATTIALTATDLDAPATWYIRGLPTGIARERGDAGGPAQTRITGTAAELFLALVRRSIVDDAQIDGDPDVWRRWLSATPL